MFSPAKEQIFLCEQCGIALPADALEKGCLHCLLTGGLEMTDRIEDASPNEYNVRFYQHYEILKRADGTPWELGRGSMGVTYKAHDSHLNTPVALKLINGRFALRPDARKRFLREAQAAARLRHPNVASVFHFGTLDDCPDDRETKGDEKDAVHRGDCFFAMEFIEGETLAARLKRCGPLSAELAIALGVQVARALSAAEHRGLIHRDLKPSNIMLASSEFPSDEGISPPSQDWVKVIDFGLAKREDDPERPSRKFIGTRAFASPEQLESRAVDSRADIYSLGATLWYSLCGKVPSKSTTGLESKPDLRTNTPRSDSALNQRNVPATLIALLKSSLATNPDDRPGTALEFGLKLQECLEDMRSGPLSLRGATRLHGISKWALTTAAAIFVAGLVMIGLFTVPTRQTGGARSVAVMPFRNLSGEPADAEYVNRVQRDILSQLGKIRNLRVIDLVGAGQNPAKPSRDLHEIGRIFNIKYILEGSLRRTEDHAYLHLALIDTTDGHELWAEGYDRHPASVANLCGDLTLDIADALGATLALRKNGRVHPVLTNKPDAHELYLRGCKFEQTLSFAISNYEAAEMLYTQAIALDPRFSPAHARLASVLALLYTFRGPNEELKIRAYDELREALRLEPNLGEAHLVSAWCSYWFERDLDQTLLELEKARHFLPDDTGVGNCLALVKRVGGDWRAARTKIHRCLTWDPGNVTYEEELYVTNYLVRDWVGAEESARRIDALVADQPLATTERAMVEVWKSGDITAARKILEKLPSYGDSEGILTWARWDAALLARDYSAAKKAIDRFPFETLNCVFGVPIPKAYLEGCIALSSGDTLLAREKFERCRPAYEAEALAYPNSGLRHSRLGLLYAFLGRAKDAINEGKRAVELVPIESDHVKGPEALSYLALIYARLGDNDRALTAIQTLLQMPGAVFPGEASISLWELRLRWQWDPLRGDPRFNTMLAGSEPVTNY